MKSEVYLSGRGKILESRPKRFLNQIAKLAVMTGDNDGLDEYKIEIKVITPLIYSIKIILSTTLIYDTQQHKCVK